MLNSLNSAKIQLNKFQKAFKNEVIIVNVLKVVINRAGKSPTIKAIVGLLPEMEGKIEIMGQNKNYAYIPEQPILYEDLTLWEHLELAAAAYEIESNIFLEKSERLLGIFRLKKVILQVAF